MPAPSVLRLNANGWRIEQNDGTGCLEAGWYAVHFPTGHVEKSHGVITTIAGPFTDQVECQKWIETKGEAERHGPRRASITRGAAEVGQGDGPETQ